MQELRRVLRSTLSVDAATLTFNDGAGHTSAKSLAGGNYLNKGETGSGSPADLIQAVRALFNAAYLSLYGSAGSVVATLSSDGHLSLSGAAAPLALQVSGTTFDTALLGFGAGAITLGPGIVVTAPNQVQGCWYPCADHVLDTGELVRRAFTQHPSLLGIPDIIKHAGTADVSYRRRLAWDDVDGARVLRWLTDQAAYAAVAGLAEGDPNAAFERVIERCVDDNNEFYLFEGDTPASHVQVGPYYLVLDDQTVADGGVPFSAEREDLLQRRFRISIELRR